MVSSYKAGIIQAIAELQDHHRNGASTIAIKKLMQSRHPDGQKWLDATFLQALKSGVATGEFVRTKNSYKLSSDNKTTEKQANKARTASTGASPKKELAAKVKKSKKEAATDAKDEGKKEEAKTADVEMKDAAATKKEDAPFLDDSKEEEPVKDAADDKKPAIVDATKVKKSGKSRKGTTVAVKKSTATKTKRALKKPVQKEATAATVTTKRGAKVATTAKAKKATSSSNATVPPALTAH